MVHRNNRNLDFVWGVLIVLLINICVMIFLWTPVISEGLKHKKSIDRLVPYFNLAINIDVGQFLYILPLIIWLAFEQKWEFMKGVILGSVITVLLNFGSCFLF